MGADLYNKGQDVPILGFEVSDRAVDAGYFRDAYNSSSVLRLFGLSWWVDITKLQNEDGVITAAKVKKFRALLKKHEGEFEENLSKAEWIGGDKFSEEDKKASREHAALLKKYLDTAIKNGYEIEASL